eukprot:23861_1
MGNLSCCSEYRSTSQPPNNASRLQTTSPKSHLQPNKRAHEYGNTKSEEEDLIQPSENQTLTKESPDSNTSKLKLKITNSDGENKKPPLTNLPSFPLHSIQSLQYSRTEDIHKSKYFVQFLKNTNNKIDTEFIIKPIEEYINFKQNNIYN